MTIKELADELRPIALKLEARQGLSATESCVRINLMFLMSLLDEVAESKREACANDIAATSLATMMQVLYHYHGHPDDLLGVVSRASMQHKES